MAGTIYVVTNNLNGKQYVGQTVVAANKVGHGYMVTAAYKKYGKQNFSYEVVKSEIPDRSTLNYLERFWIKAFDSRTPNGYNIEHGGSDKDKVSDETRELKRQQNLGKKHSSETKAKMSAAHRNKTEEQKAEYKAKLSASRTGRKFSSETRAKLSAKARGRIVSEETKAKIRAARANQVISEETKLKLSEAAKRQWARQKGVA